MKCLHRLSNKMSTGAVQKLPKPLMCKNVLHLITATVVTNYDRSSFTLTKEGTTSRTF